MWKSLGREFRALDAMNRSELWMTWMILCHKLKPLNVMNHSGLTWMTLGYELSALNTMNNSGSWLTWKIPSHELKVLNVMNNLRLWTTWMKQGHELKDLNTMNNSELWLTWTTPIYKLRDLDAINHLEVLIGWATLVHELWASGCHEKLSAPNSILTSGLWMTYATPGHLLRPLDAMNNLELWMIWMTHDPMSLEI